MTKSTLTITKQHDINSLEKLESSPKILRFRNKRDFIAMVFF